MRKFKFLGAMLVFLVSLESCKGCAVGAGAGADCPAGQEQINGACVAKCPADQFRVGTACSVCPAGQVKVNGACAPFTGTCPTGQINIDDGKTSAATSCKAVVHVANKNDLIAEIKKATAGGNWTANLNYIDTSAVTDMQYLFADKAQTTAGYDLEKFNGRIDKWNTSSVTIMAHMFEYATAFDQPIGNWKTDNVTNMNSTFKGASKFNQDIGNWKVNNVTNVNGMFWGATVFDRDLSRWTPAITGVSLVFLANPMLTANKLKTFAPWYCTAGGTDGGC